LDPRPCQLPWQAVGHVPLGLEARAVADLTILMWHIKRINFNDLDLFTRDPAASWTAIQSVKSRSLSQLDEPVEFCAQKERGLFRGLRRECCARCGNGARRYSPVLAGAQHLAAPALARSPTRRRIPMALPACNSPVLPPPPARFAWKRQRSRHHDWMLAAARQSAALVDPAAEFLRFGRSFAGCPPITPVPERAWVFAQKRQRVVFRPPRHPIERI
jgi:hypothetical protein